MAGAKYDQPKAPAHLVQKTATGGKGWSNNKNAYGKGWGTGACAPQKIAPSPSCVPGSGPPGLHLQNPWADHLHNHGTPENKAQDGNA